MQRIIETERGRFFIRPYKAVDETEVLSLWRLVFEKPIPKALWRWKYPDNPFGHQILIGIDETKELVSVYGGIPYPSEYRNDGTRLTQLMDIMTHPKVRKSGLFVKAAHLYFEFVEENETSSLFLYGFPGQYHLEIGEKYLGYRKLPKPVVFLRKILKQRGPKENRFSGTLEYIENINGALLDTLWERCKIQYPLSVIRNWNFIQWRFTTHPLHKYEIFVYISNSKELCGYQVFSIEGKNARLIDVLVPDAPDIIEDFFFQMEKYLFNKGLEVIESWLPSSHFITCTLYNLGYKSFPEPIGFSATVKRFENISPSLEWISDNLFYTMADADIF